MAHAELSLVPARGARSRPDLGGALREMGLLSEAAIAEARAEARRLGTGLAELLRARRLVSAAALTAARTRASGALEADLAADPPDPRLVDLLGATDCLRLGVVPWKRVGAAVLVAGPDPAAIRGLGFGAGPVIPVIAPEDDVRAAILRLRGPELARAAETRVEAAMSCRAWPIRETRIAALIVLAIGLAWALAAPFGFVTAVLAWSLLTMSALTGLKLVAALLHLVLGPVRHPDPHHAAVPLAIRPTVSVLVPLFRETGVAEKLVKRLSRLIYPKELLEICLIVEEDDAETRAALARTELPAWFTVVTVPPGAIRTKPRALNYALDVARGRIIGVWDAEDAPEADQIDRVVSEFLRRDPKVACLQGRLAWYNARRNWLTRCFAIEYATWFRIVLPGLARIGWPVPLGGTSVFFRRAALEELGGWDAHNVTEDADLGIRLARHGYRTELVDTITYEEATARLVPWIRQRSRWLKGYAMTYAVHMRSPRRLLADLGPWRFLGVQVVFLATLSQFVLAPLLWSFWPAAFGLWHPFGAVLPPDWPRAIALLFLGAEAAAVAVGLLAVSERGQRDLMPVVPTLSCYFPFATLAAAKAMWELAWRPFFWDKTNHGEGPDAPKA